MSPLRLPAATRSMMPYNLAFPIACLSSVSSPCGSFSINAQGISTKWSAPSTPRAPHIVRMTRLKSGDSKPHARESHFRNSFFARLRPYCQVAEYKPAIWVREPLFFHVVGQAYLHSARDQLESLICVGSGEGLGNCPNDHGDAPVLTAAAAGTTVVVRG